MTENSFGKTLAKLRKERKLTQQELADLLHVTNKTISKWETNTTAPDIDTLKRISQVLNVTVDVLLGNSKSTIIEKSNKHKFTKIKWILLPSILLISLISTCYIAFVFLLNTKTYSFISGDARFTVEGNITTDKNQYYLSLIIKGLNDELLENKTISNAEYSVIVNDKIIYNNGDILSLDTLPQNFSLSKYISKISINHEDKRYENLKSILENGLILQIKYIDENSNLDIINIPVMIINN